MNVLHKSTKSHSVYLFIGKSNVDWPVFEVEAASLMDTAVRCASAELRAFGPAVDLGDAYGGRKGTSEGLAHHSYPQALLVAAACWWASEAVKAYIYTQTRYKFPW